MRWRRVVSVGLVVGAIVWARLDSRFEGPVLISIDQQHGVVLADLVSIGLIFIAGWLWFA